MSNFTVEVEGIEELKARLTDPSLVEKAVEEGIIKPSAISARNEMITRLAGGTGQAKISTQADVEPLMAKVYSAMPQARSMSIEEGRKSGERPPVLQIARWYTGRRHLTGRRLSDLSKSEQRTIDDIRESIKGRGTKGKKFVGGSADKVRADMPKMIAVTALQIEQNWERSQK